MGVVSSNLSVPTIQEVVCSLQLKQISWPLLQYAAGAFLYLAIKWFQGDFFCSHRLCRLKWAGLALKQGAMPCFAKT
ncbi:MAG: hypothetical protein CSB47_03015 [Proteobacteria bacterium]|nr:MAG: hypothetical protein CSB47_03015 [Pseudomonadota bacterium]